MGDMGDMYGAMKDHKKELRERLGVACPDCTVKLPKAQAKILLPEQKCWCGYRDPRRRQT